MLHSSAFNFSILSLIFFKKLIYVLLRASLRNAKDWVLPKLERPDYRVCHEILTNIFFLNYYIIQKDIYLFVTHIFSEKKFFSVIAFFCIKFFLHKTSILT